MRTPWLVVMEPYSFFPTIGTPRGYGVLLISPQWGPLGLGLWSLIDRSPRWVPCGLGLWDLIDFPPRWTTTGAPWPGVMRPWPWDYGALLIFPLVWGPLGFGMCSLIDFSTLGTPWLGHSSTVGYHLKCCEPPVSDIHD